MEERSVKERKKLIDKKAAALSLRLQCQLMQVNRSSLYVEPKGERKENLHIMSIMDKAQLRYPTKGVKGMQDILKDQGLCVNHKRVRRLLRLMGIEAIYPRRKLSRLGLAKYIQPYLLRNMKVERPNQVWAIDISYIPMQKGFMYLTAVIDLYSRYIVGWQLSNSLEVETQTTLIKELVRKHGKPEVINSDQGSQYTSREWIALLSSNEIKISMDGKGRATDNAFIERFFRSIKQEYVYLHPESDGVALYEGIAEYIRYYNGTRRHQGIGRRRPADLYQQAA